MNDAESAEILRTLGQETRLRIFRLLARSPEPGLSSGFISASVDVAPALASFHLKELSRAGLVHKQSVGRFTMYSIDRTRLESVFAGLVGEFTLAGASANDPSLNPDRVGRLPR